MAKLNTRSARSRTGVSPVTTERTPSGVTYEGGAGYARDTRSELFLLAVSSLFGEDKFYETADAGTRRYVHLVREAAAVDPDWTAGFLRWLRHDANIRTAAIVGAAEYAVGRRDEAGTGRTGTVHPTPSFTVRQVINSVMVRADEPGEFVAYWRANVQRSLPGGVQRGVADAVIRLYTERNFLKWDSDKRGYGFADVLNLTHPGDVASSAQKLTPWQRDLFSYVVGKRYREVELPESLQTLIKNRWLRTQTDTTAWLNETILRDAGVTWEDALSAVGSKIDKRRLWEAVIPSMSYMGILRNLRNFDEAGVSDEVAEATGRILAEPDAVRRSRQLPMRFLSAYRAAPSLRWGPYLEKALNLSLANISELGGRTLILVDTSSSMNSSFSKDGTLKRWDAAVIFGLALAQRCQHADVVSFSSAQRYYGDARGANTKVFTPRKGASLLLEIERWKSGGWFLGGGTDTAAAVRKHNTQHDRIVILTDEQAGSDPLEVSASAPATTPMYTFNLAGYERGHAPAGVLNRHTFGGLTDQAFQLIPLLEAGRDGAWPWETEK
jgi:TROVE domain